MRLVPIHSGQETCLTRVPNSWARGRLSSAVWNLGSVLIGECVASLQSLASVALLPGLDPPVPFSKSVPSSESWDSRQGGTFDRSSAAFYCSGFSPGLFFPREVSYQNTKYTQFPFEPCDLFRTVWLYGQRFHFFGLIQHGTVKGILHFLFYGVTEPEYFLEETTYML